MLNYAERFEREVIGQLVVNPDHEVHEDEGVNMDHDYEEEDLGGNEEEEPPAGAPGGVGPRIARNLPPRPMRREYLCERLCKMKPPLFEGTTNPLEAEDWLSTMETILDFMELRDKEKITCAVYVLRKEARAQQTEFLNFKQENMTVTDAVRKFERLAKLCPYLVPTEEQRVKRMPEMFRPDISLSVEGGSDPPTTTTDCVERAYRAEHRLNQLKEMKNRMYENKRKQNNQSSNQNRGQQVSQPQGQNKNNKRKGNSQANRDSRQPAPKKNNATYPTCGKCGKNHPGECRQGTTACYKCGKEGHFARKCTVKSTSDSQQNRNQEGQFRSLQTLTEGPVEGQDIKNVLEPNARVYAYTKGDAEAGGSKVVTGQLPVAYVLARVLIDSGATHSFISTVFADSLHRSKDTIRQTFRTVLPSGDIMLSSY
ncbi:hypothetical protein UlMin_028849 [Ulmus minor]